MKDGSIIYFGTMGCPGHYARVLKGGCDDLAELRTTECALDALFDRPVIAKTFEDSKDPFHHFSFYDGTVFGCRLSPDDRRGGSKTLVCVHNAILSKKEMIDLIKNDVFLKERFTAVCNKYNLENIFEHEV